MRPARAIWDERARTDRLARNEHLYALRTRGMSVPLAPHKVTDPTDVNAPKLGSFVEFRAHVYAPPFTPYYDAYRGQVFKVTEIDTAEGGVHIGLACVSDLRIRVQGMVHPEDLRPARGIVLKMVKVWGERCRWEEDVCPCCVAWGMFDRTGNVPAAHHIHRRIIATWKAER
jgi:hypothetical protein